MVLSEKREVASHNFIQPATMAAVAILAAFAWEAWFFLVAGRSGTAAVGGAIWALFCVAAFAAIVLGGQVASGRGLFFAASALAFVPAFVANLVEARGRMAVTGAEVLSAQVPFCHIAITTSILPAALFRTLDFPAQLSGTRASFYPMLLYWLLSLVTVGRGWCSWVCFYGGIEDGLSSLPRKARLDLGKSGPELRRINLAVLAFIALAGLGSLVPVYCDWLCPFKLVTEYSAPVDARSYLALILFIGLFLGLVVVLPLLSKRRTQCSILCPFGALQSLLDRLSPFRVAIDKSACLSCGACDRACPMLALGPEARERGGPGGSCVKCGRCFDCCPRKAIGFAPRLPRSGESPLDLAAATLRAKGGVAQRAVAFVLEAVAALLSPTLLFPFTALSFGMIISTGFSAETMTRLVNLLAKGSFVAGGLK
jgi:Polyferredoxin